MCGGDLGPEARGDVRGNGRTDHAPPDVGGQLCLRLTTGHLAPGRSTYLVGDIGQLEGQRGGSD